MRTDYVCPEDPENYIRVTCRDYSEHTLATLYYEGREQTVFSEAILITMLWAMRDARVNRFNAPIKYLPRGLKADIRFQVEKDPLLSHLDNLWKRSK